MALPDKGGVRLKPTANGFGGRLRGREGGCGVPTAVGVAAGAAAKDGMSVAAWFAVKIRLDQLALTQPEVSFGRQQIYHHAPSSLRDATVMRTRRQSCREWRNGAGGLRAR